MFENEYTMNRNLIKEYVFNIVGKRMMIMGIILFIVGIILFLLLDDSIKYVMMTCGLIGIISAILTPLVMVNNLEAASKRLNNGKIEKTKVTFNENIVMDEGKVHLEFEYSQITKVMQTTNFIVLKLGKQSAILVLKNGFVKGTKDEFVNFINSKV